MIHKANLPCSCVGNVGVSVPHVQGGAVVGHTGHVQIGQAERRDIIEVRTDLKLKGELTCRRCGCLLSTGTYIGDRGVKITLIKL